MKNHLAVISETVPRHMADKLAERFDILRLPPDRTIAPPVSSHPDMIISQIGETFIIPQSYYEAYPYITEQISDCSGLSLTRSCAPRSAGYPLDVSLNAAVGDDLVICRKDTCAPEILSAAGSLGYRIVNVKQGYAGCSCIVTPAGVITSDKGIFSAMCGNSVYVPNNGILLPGYDIGFIGGCGGFCDGVLYFFGDIMSAAAGETVTEFARHHGYEVVPLSPDPLTDYGGIKFFMKQN